MATHDTQEAEIDAILARVKDAAARSVAALEDRDAAARDAFDAGVTASELGRALGMSRQGADNLRRRVRTRTGRTSHRNGQWSQPTLGAQ